MPCLPFLGMSYQDSPGTLELCTKSVSPTQPAEIAPSAGPPELRQAAGPRSHGPGEGLQRVALAIEDSIVRAMQDQQAAAVPMNRNFEERQSRCQWGFLEIAQGNINAFGNENGGLRNQLTDN